MKLTVDTSDLTQVVNLLAKGYHEDQLRLLATRSALVLTTDDHDARWSLSIAAKVDDPGEAYTSFKRFKGYLPKETNEANTETHLELAHRSLFLETETVKGHLPLIDSSIFPNPRSLDEPTTKVSQFERASFQAAVKACMPAVSDTPGFGYTQGIHVTTTALQGFCFSTDRKQIIRKRFRAEGAELQFTADGHQLAQTAGQSQDNVTVKYDQHVARFNDERFIADLATFAKNPPDIVAQLIEVNRASPHKAEIPSGFLLEALRICDLVGGERENFFAYLDLSPQGCRLRANGDQMDELNIDLMGTCSRAIKIYINHHSLARTLGQFQKQELLGPSVVFRIDHERSPLFVPFSEDFEEFYSAMPLNPPQLDATNEP